MKITIIFFGAYVFNNPQEFMTGEDNMIIFQCAKTTCFEWPKTERCVNLILSRRDCSLLIGACAC